MGFSRRFPAKRSDGISVPVYLNVAEQLLDGVRMFIGVLEPVDGDSGSDRSSPRRVSLPQVLSPRQSPSFESGSPPSPAGPPRCVRDFAPDVA
jgi:hypothetical protein